MYLKRERLKMAKVITLGLQKGGVSKTTTTGILAHLLAKDKKKVLAVDMDSQGNLTELLTDEYANQFIERSVLEAIAYKQPEKYIYKVNDYLDVLPANNFLALFARWIYTKKLPNSDETLDYIGQPYEQLDMTLDLVRKKYDYILIDTPPSLSEQTTNALIASDFIILLYESSKFCYSAVPNFMDSCVFAQEKSKHKPKVLGILRTLNDKRRSDAKIFNEVIAEDYPELVFDTIITRKATTGRLALHGFSDNEELDEALSQFKSFYKELLKRMKESDNK